MRKKNGAAVDRSTFWGIRGEACPVSLLTITTHASPCAAWQFPRPPSSRPSPRHRAWRHQCPCSAHSTHSMLTTPASPPARLDLRVFWLSAFPHFLLLSAPFPVPALFQARLACLMAPGQQPVRRWGGGETNPPGLLVAIARLLASRPILKRCSSQ
jgi:hypothetical protein